MYQAASQTILTVSQIKQMSFNDVKAEIGLELLYDKAEAKKQKDVEIISEYYSCKNKYIYNKQRRTKAKHLISTL